MTETPRPDPWAQVRTFDVSTYGDCRMERDYYGDITSEQTHQRGEYAWVDEVDAARAADVAEIATLRATVDQQAETIRQLQATLPELHDAIERQSAQIAALTQERDEAREQLADSAAVCVCGCPVAEHESYGEDGASCDDPAHECFRVSKAAYAAVHDLRETVTALRDNNAAVKVMFDERSARCAILTAALEELYATVKGECPSLLNEDSGGSAQLDAQVSAALAAAPQGGKP